MSVKNGGAGKVTQEQTAKDSSVSINTKAIIEKLSQNSTIAYKPYDSLKGRYIKISKK